MPHLRSIGWKYPPDSSVFPFAVPAIRSLDTIEPGPQVTVTRTFLENPGRVVRQLVLDGDGI